MKLAYVPEGANALLQSRRRCKVCGEKTLHAKPHFSGGIGCILTVLTCGLFIPLWFLIGLFGALQPWRCQQCGQARHL